MAGCDAVTFRSRALGAKYSPLFMSKKLAISLLSVWFVSALVAGYVLWAFKPHGPAKWLLFLVAGTPLYLLLSGVGELLGEAYAMFPGIRHGNEFVERHTVGRSLSALRILWYLFTGLVAIGAVIAMTWFCRTYL